MADENNMRSPICSVLGHVDHGKSSILDSIRSTSIAKAEAGNITQAIGASIIPLHVIKKTIGDLFSTIKGGVNFPGLLFIDTPGHAAFTSLRKRGGNIADIAILVVDINDGFKPQTKEAVEILKNSKTPFIIAANKIDMITGWMPAEGNILQKISKQSQTVVETFEKRMYEIVGQIAEQGLNSERFDRVSDYTKQIAIVPTSAKTGEGIPELLMVITGLAQKFLENCLKCDIAGQAKGTILEVKNVKGLGNTLDVILFDGSLNVGDTVVIGSLNEPIVTKVKALLEPKPLAEMRDKKAKFDHVKKVTAATGVKISAPNIEEVVAGMPLMSASEKNLESTKEEIMSQVEDVIIDKDQNGIVIKADSLGSIEAMVNLLKGANIPIRKATIGNITKTDIIDAQSNIEQDPFLGVVIGFNVETDFVESGDVKVITGEVIYSLIDEYEKWKDNKRKEIEMKELQGVTKPCRLRMMPGYIFRQSNPAVFGVEVELGNVKTGITLMNLEGKRLGNLKGIQKDQKNVDDAKKNDQVAVSVEGVTIGRQVNENDIMYSQISEDDFKKLKELKKLLDPEDVELLKEIALIMRKSNPVWGV